MIKRLWLFVISLYAIQVILIISMFVPENNEDLLNVFVNLLYCVIAFSLIISIINIFSTLFRLFDNKMPCGNPDLLRHIARCKLVLVPFYIINFIIWIVVAAVSIIPILLIYLGGILWIAIFLGSIFTYLTLLTTSSHAIVQIVALKRARVISLVECVVHIVLQFIYVADIADIIYLSKKYASKKNNEINSNIK